MPEAPARAAGGGGGASAPADVDVVTSSGRRKIAAHSSVLVSHPFSVPFDFSPHYPARRHADAVREFRC